MNQNDIFTQQKKEEKSLAKKKKDLCLIFYNLKEIIFMKN